VFAVRVGEEQLREELVLNISFFLFEGLGRHYVEDFVLNINVFVVKFW
jgi:hypothetical protein